MNGGGDDDGNIIRQLNWCFILMKLYAQANCYLKGMPEVFNGGTSAEDIVHSMLVEFFASGNLCGWDPARSPVAKEQGLEAGLKSFLSVILERRMIDHVRANGRHAFVPINSERTTGYHRADNKPNGEVLYMEDRVCSVENHIEFSELQDSLIRKAAGDQIAIGMIIAAPEITGSGKVDQDLAEMVMGDREATDEIIKARKRLQRRLKKTAKGCEPWTNQTNRMDNRSERAETNERPENKRSAG